VAARFHAVQASVIGEVEAATESYRSAVAEFGEADKTLSTVERREKAIRRGIELQELDRTALAGIALELVQVREARLGALKRTEDALGALEDAVQRPLGSRGAVPEPGSSRPRGEDQ
jgi:hypothetical protein